MNPEIISVKQFVAILNETLMFAYPSVTIEGEVSGFKVNQGKWVFFDLKDDEASLGCFMPLSTLKVELEDGMQVRVSGSPRLTKWGKFSFTVRSIELAGEGALRRAYDLLKAKLEAEGLFAETRKRALPLIPRRIGLITSGQSAAYADFMKILNSRWGGIEVQLVDVQVQGAKAPAQIMAAFDYFDELADPVDVVVLIRGGGSLEDLQAFNTEAVCRAVAGSRTPTIVGVGHEVDTSLADLAADRRAVTPTDAARLAVPDRQEVRQRLRHLQRSMEACLSRHLRAAELDLTRRLSALQHHINLPKERLRLLESRLWHSLNHSRSEIRLSQQRLDGWQQRLLASQMLLLRQQAEQLTGMARVLASYDPKATLRRGYAIVRKGEKVLKAASTVQPGDSLMIQLAKGQIGARVERD